MATQFLLGMSVILGAITLFCLLVTVLFIKGYRHGMAVAFIRMGSRLPFLKKKVLHFAETHKEKLENIDKQIALLHRQKKRTFYSALFLEYTARVVSCLEIWLILNVLTTNVSFADCCLIAAFPPCWPIFCSSCRCSSVDVKEALHLP